MPLPVLAGDPEDYEPRRWGAQCDRCILYEMRTGLPVPPETNPNVLVAAIAEAPGEDEVLYGRPLIGPSGIEEMRAMGTVGLVRDQVHWGNAVCCRPPGNNYDAVLASLRGRNAAIRRRNERVREENRERRKRGEALLALEEELPTPVEACRPRLMAELRQAGIRFVVALGKISLQALDPHHTAGIITARGNPVAFRWEGNGLARVPPDPTGHFPLGLDEVIPAALPRQVQGDVLTLPTVHPAFVLRAGRWRGPFDADHAKATRLFTGTLTWRNPEMIFNPALLRFARLLGVVPRAVQPADAQHFPLGPPDEEHPWRLPVPRGWSGGWWADPQQARVLAYDWETDALEPIECIARCVQIGTKESVQAPFFASVDGTPSAYGAAEREVLVHMLRAWLTGPGWKYSHNGGAYDVLVNMAFLGVRGIHEADQIMGHRLIEGELPHNLRYVGSRYEDVHDWKAGDPGVNARSNRELGTYGCLDTAVTDSTAHRIFTEVAARGLGGFAGPGCSTRLLRGPSKVTRTVVETPKGSKTVFSAEPVAPAELLRTADWWWARLDPGIPFGLPQDTLVVHDPGAPNQADPQGQPGLVAFPQGLVTPQTPRQAAALAAAGAPVVREGLGGLLALDHVVQEGCVGMHANGMLIDQEQRLRFLHEQSGRFEVKRQVLRDAVADLGVEWDTAGRPFNPASVAHLRKLLYEVWELPVTVESEKTRQPSTGDSAVRKLLALDNLPDRARSLLLALRDFRKAHKILGTYLYPTGLRPLGGKQRPVMGWGRAWDVEEKWDTDVVLEAEEGDEPDWDDEEQAVELEKLEGADVALAAAAFRAQYLRSDRSKLRINGRIHASWLAHASVTGRISSSPNLLNIIRWLRSMFIPASLQWLEAELDRMRASPNEVRLWSAYGVDLNRFKPKEGHLFVYADSDQLELRAAASRWKAARYLEAFATRKLIGGVWEWMDPHQITMHAIWGDAIWSVEGAPTVRYYKTYKKGSEYDRMRDLSKRVLYASAAPDTQVAVLSGEVAQRIDSIQPGTWIWAWSRQRQRLEPSKVVRAWMSGHDRKLHKVTFRDKSGNTFHERFTGNHLFLLRTGECRAVTALAPGDRLMPYKEFVGKHGYRMVDATNEGGWVQMHRHVAFRLHDLEAGAEDWHVHHQDQDKCNNSPENLEVLSPSAHSVLHQDAALGAFNVLQWSPAEYQRTCTRLAESRLASDLWWERAHGSEARAKRAGGLQAHWDDPVRSAAHREAISGIQESCLDVLAHEIGAVPDQTIADKIGCTAANVLHWRKRRGIPSWEETMRKRHGLKRDAIKVHPLLGKIPDAQVARDLGCDRALVHRVRRDLDVADPPREPSGLKGQLKGSKFDAYAGFFGVIPAGEIAEMAGRTPATASAYAKSRGLLRCVDYVRAWAFKQEVGRVADARLADLLGVSASALEQYRARHGIPAYGTMPAGDDDDLNHEVVSVEELPGLHDVWDLEVEHEDHNFALASGIVVHNSIYGALAPTVHDVITSAEDKKGNLMYPNLKLPEVRLMQRNLLKNMPEFRRGWEWELATLRVQGHLLEPVGGRRFDCLDGADDLSLVVNRCIQSSGASYMAMATAEMLEKYPFGFGGPYTGLVNHCHDAMTWEVPASMAEQVAADLTDTMTRILPCYPDMRFLGSAEVCTVWQ